MKKSVIVLVALLLPTAALMAQSVAFDYDRDADLEIIETFAWVGSSETSLAARAPLAPARGPWQEDLDFEGA